MSGLDIVLGGLIMAAVIIEGFRGFGRAGFDALALFGALFLAAVSYQPLAANLHLVSGAGANEAACYGMCFGIYAVLALVLSHFIHGALLLNLGMFDHLMGVAAGVFVGVMLAHGIVRSFDILSITTSQPSIVASSAIGPEVLNFTTYHSVMDTMYSMTGGPSVRKVATN